MVPVMPGLTIRTSPFSDGEASDLTVFVTADMTKLAGGKEAICLIDGPSVPSCLITKHVDESRPGSIGDGFCQLMVLEYIHNP